MAVRVNHNRRASPVHGCYDTIVSRGNQATGERRAHVPHSLLTNRVPERHLYLKKVSGVVAAVYLSQPDKRLSRVVVFTFIWRVGAGEADLGQVESFNQFAEI